MFTVPTSLLAGSRSLPIIGLSRSSSHESKHMFEAKCLHGAYGNEKCLNYLTSARGMSRSPSMSFAEFMASRRTLSLPSTAENLTSLPFNKDIDDIRLPSPTPIRSPTAPHAFYPDTPIAHLEIEPGHGRMQHHRTSSAQLKQDVQVHMVPRRFQLLDGSKSGS